MDTVLYSSSGKEIYPPNLARPKYIVSNKIAVVVGAHTSTEGYFWIFNPIASTKKVAIRRIVCRIATVTALVLLTAPRISVERMTSVTDPSGAMVTAAKMETAEVAPVAKVTAVSTGLTPVAGAVVTAFLCPAAMTAVGAGTVVVDQNFIPNISEEIILAAGEGLVIRQADAGTTADTRIAIIDIVWEEY